MIMIQSKKECPRCNEETLSVQRWYDDVGMVEELLECNDCGYRYHWSYGYVIDDESEEEEDE